MNKEDKGEVSDGYHTFNELYEHRYLLFISLCQAYRNLAWRSTCHHNGTCYDGYFIAGLALPTGTITYHLPIKYYGIMYGVEALPVAPEWDRHTSDDVIDRLIDFCHLSCHCRNKILKKEVED